MDMDENDVGASTWGMGNERGRGGGVGEGLCDRLEGMTGRSLASPLAPNRNMNREAYAGERRRASSGRVDGMFSRVRDGAVSNSNAGGVFEGGGEGVTPLACRPLGCEAGMGAGMGCGGPGLGGGGGGKKSARERFKSLRREKSNADVEKKSGRDVDRVVNWRIGIGVGEYNTRREYREGSIDPAPSSASA